MKSFKQYLQESKNLSVKDLFPDGIRTQGLIDLSFKKLTSLEGCPNESYSNFSCSNNLLTTLNGAPKIARSDFFCSSNGLISLEGCPEEINGMLSCCENKLTSFKGIAKKVGLNIDIDRNLIKSLKDVDSHIDYVGYYIDLSGNNILEGGLGLLKINGLKEIKLQRLMGF